MVRECTYSIIHRVHECLEASPPTAAGLRLYDNLEDTRVFPTQNVQQGNHTTKQMSNTSMLFQCHSSILPLKEQATAGQWFPASKTGEKSIRTEAQQPIPSLGRRRSAQWLRRGLRRRRAPRGGVVRQRSDRFQLNKKQARDPKTCPQIPIASNNSKMSFWPLHEHWTKSLISWSL